MHVVGSDEVFLVFLFALRVRGFSISGFVRFWVVYRALAWGCVSGWGFRLSQCGAVPLSRP